MEEKDKLDLLINLIEEGKFIKLYKLMKDETDKVFENLLTGKYLEIKEHPDNQNIEIILTSYENDVSTLIKMLTILCKFRKNDHYDIISETVDRFINIEKNEKDGFGYIWRHISNYPLLLVTYCLGISFLRNNNIEDLYKLLNKQITQRYFGRDNVEYFKTTLVEGINAYHVFNSIDNMSVDVYQYLPAKGTIDPTNQSSVQKRLNANNRIFEFLENRMKYFFRDKEEFSSYFDLYEFFTGLFFMDKRLVQDSLKFAPYGRNFRMYSGSGRYFVVKDTLVQNYMNAIKNKNNDILKVGFFEGKKDRFENAHKEYVTLLSAISNSRE